MPPAPIARRWSQRACHRRSVRTRAHREPRPVRHRRRHDAAHLAFTAQRRLPRPGTRVASRSGARRSTYGRAQPAAWRLADHVVVVAVGVRHQHPGRPGCRRRDPPPYGIARHSAVHPRGGRSPACETTVPTGILTPLTRSCRPLWTRTCPTSNAPSAPWQILYPKKTRTPILAGHDQAHSLPLARTRATSSRTRPVTDRTQQNARIPADPRVSPDPRGHRQCRTERLFWISSCRSTSDTVTTNTELAGRSRSVRALRTGVHPASSPWIRGSRRTSPPSGASSGEETRRYRHVATSNALEVKPGRQLRRTGRDCWRRAGKPFVGLPGPP